MNYKLVHNAQMHNEKNANKQVVIALAYNTSCHCLKQCFSHRRQKARLAQMLFIVSSFPPLAWITS